LTAAAPTPEFISGNVDAIRQAALFERVCRWKDEGALSAFVRLVWPEVEPRALEWAPYMGTICRALHRQMLGDEEYARILINIPPGMAKSLLVSVFGPAFEWLFSPGRRKLFFAGDDALAKRDSRRTRLLMQSPIYQRLLAEVCKREGRKPWVFAFDQNEKTNYENTDRGFRQVLTLRAGVTGKRGDDFVIDDPIDVKAVINGGPEAIDRRCREVANTIDQALETRVNDMRDARQTIIMQRLHINDPAGHAIREGGWHHICMPMEYNASHKYAYDHDPRTERGELLNPARTPLDKLERLRKKLGPQQASAQLDQLPTPAQGGQIKRAWFGERYSCPPEDIAATADEVWVSVDAAKKGKDSSDFHAMQVWAKRGGKKYPLDRITDRMGYPEFERALDGLIEKWRYYLSGEITESPGGVLIEDTANGTTYMQIRGEAHVGIPLVPFHPSTDTPGKDKSKGARAVYVERAAESRAIVLPEPSIAPWVEPMLSCWCAFPMVTNDDDMDATSQIVMRWAVEAGTGTGQMTVDDWDDAF
jgi:predicted phage terminase large subunit-like protein